MFPDLRIEGFLAILERYNTDIWPLQIFSYILGIAVIVMAAKRTGYSNRVISLILSFFWLWSGIVFCILYWNKSFKLAYIFGILLTIQGLIFLYGFIKENISFSYTGDFYSSYGILMIFYALIGYFLIGLFIGHTYPRSFPFGLVPCPTAIFTLGILLWTDKKVPRHILIIPALLSLSGVIAIIKTIYEDMGLLILGLLAVILIIYRDKRT